MRTARYEDVRDAIDEGRLRVDLSTGLIEGRRLDPKAQWRPKKLEAVASPGQPPYYRVTFTTSKGRFRCLIHRVVWFAGRGAIPDDLTVDHGNFDRSDNRLENLELVTMGENTRRAVESGRLDLHSPKNWSLTEEQVRAIRRRLEEGASQRKVARELKTSPNVVNRIARRRTYRSVV